VLERVDPRHLNGVVVASSRDPIAGMDAYERFVDQYEALHRKTLRSPIPAFGYDAAMLLLEAIDRGARSPDDVADALDGISDFPAATGRISIQDGQIVRRHYLYEIRDRQLIPLGRDVR
jgi:ABC-type branched-subunit amino acid transport system substrate-binding protein